MGLIVGVDPGLATMGVVLMELFPDKEIVRGATVFTTKPETKKRAVRASDDNVRRATYLYTQLSKRLDKYEVNAICIEAQSWPRNASASAKVGISWGVIIAAAAERGLPMLQASPQAIKKALTGSNQASKLDVQAAVLTLYPGMKLPKQKTLREHAADAVGAVVACFDSDVVKMVRQL